MLWRYGSDERTRARPNRTRTRHDRKAGPARLFPDCLGHRSLLPRAQHSRSGTRLRRQQRCLLRAGNHRRRSRRHGPAFRAIPLRRTRRVARHRSRPAQRRPARARHSIRVRALRKTGRGHDRQRHHLSRPLGRSRNRQGIVVRSGNPESPDQLGGRLGIPGRQGHTRAPVPRCRP